MRYLLFLLFCCSAYSGIAQGFDTFYVHFDVGAYVPGNIGEDGLKEVAAGLLKEDRSGSKILVYGYADYLGSLAPNKTLSQQRADAVAGYLKRKGIAADRFLVVKGLGQQDDMGRDGESGNADNRKTMVLVSHRKNIARRGADKQPEKAAADYAIYKIPKADTLEQETFRNLENLLQHIESTPRDSSFVLENIYFELHKDVILPRSLPALRSLLVIMQHYPQLKIVIEGHICCNEIDGSDPRTAAYQLSVFRAKRIYTYLTVNQIEPARLHYRGFGRTRPVFAEEQNNMEMEANRRVEIRIKSK